jgi:hypothetical protein
MYKLNDFYIFPSQTLENLHINDCNTSVTGVCERVDHLEKCIDICKSQQPCNSGYFIQDVNDASQNICVPLRNSSVSSSAGPYYRLRPQSIYPFFQDESKVQSIVFSSEENPFPPKHVNNIFFTDSLTIQNVTTKKFVGLDDEASKVEESKVMNDVGTELQLIPKEFLATSLSKYIIVKHGDEIVIGIPSTSYILQKVYNGIIDEVKWERKATLNETAQTFQIWSTNSARNTGDYLNFDETFYFTSDGFIIVYDTINDLLSISAQSLQNLEQNTIPFTFKFRPDFKVFFCNPTSGLCDSVALKKCETKGDEAFFDGVPVVRNRDCWNMCLKGEETSETFSTLHQKRKKNKIGDTKRRTHAVLYILIIAMSVCVVLVWCKNKKNSFLVFN